ncbi:hypothetical protein A4X13_0g7602 [Tilletia indica]|uniref:HAT C-terminal dimerisation domain-containing protein n=1 Tax=Tilletia indica TaxID=43049 RepID=A0A177TCJ4_9BASI|nr:hypothetical protein A4X13_0g7602 [Tilletia indica]
MSPPSPDPPESAGQARRYGTRPDSERRAPAGLSGFVVGDSDASSSSVSSISKPSHSSSTQRPKPRPYDRSAHPDDEDDDPALPIPRIARQQAADAEEIAAMMEEELGPQKRSIPSGSSGLLKSLSISKGKTSTSSAFNSAKSRSTTAKSIPTASAHNPPILKKKASTGSLKALALKSVPKITDSFKPRSSLGSSFSPMGPPAAPRSSAPKATTGASIQAEDLSDDEAESQPGDNLRHPIEIDNAADSDGHSSVSHNNAHRRKNITPEGALKAAKEMWTRAQKDAQGKADAEANGQEWKAAPGKRASTAYVGFDEPFIGSKYGQDCILFPCKCCTPPQTIHRPFTDSSTSSLLNHLKHLKAKEESNQLSIAEILSRQGTTTTTTSAVLPPSAVRQMMVAWISESSRPISIVGDRGFLAFFSEEQRALMPSRFTISRDVTRVFLGMNKHLKKELAAVEGCFHLATDVWTSANGYSFLGLIVCYQRNGQAIRRLLEMVPFLTTHDSAHLATATYNVLEKYEITQRLWNIVSDNASENTKMMKLLAAKNGLPRFTANEDGRISCRVRCAAHVLNLISKAVLSGFSIARKAKGKGQDAAGDDGDDGADGSADDYEQDDWVDEDMVDDDALGEDADEDDVDEDECDGHEEEDVGRAVEDEDDFEISTSLNPDDTAIVEDEEDVQKILSKVPSKLSARQNLELQMRNKEVGTALRKLAWLAQQFRYNPAKRRSFRKECERLSCKTPHTIVRDVATRWNSTFDMIESGLRLWKGIIAYTERDNTPIPKNKRLKRTDEDDLRKLFEFLKPISDATLKFSHKDVPTIGEVIGLFEDLDRGFVQIQNKEGEALVWTQAASRAHAVNAKYYGLTEQAEVYTLGMLLHPNYRSMFMTVLKWPDDWKEEAEQLLRDVYAAYYQRSPEAEKADGSQTPNFDNLDPTTQALMRMAKAKQESSSHDVIAEWFDNFTPLSADGRRVDPLHWWWTEQQKGNDHEGLTAMALDVFSCPATSVDVERLFSRAGRVVSPLRHRLKAAKIAQLVTVGKWFLEGSVPETLLPDVLTEEKDARRAKRKARASTAAETSTKRSKPNNAPEIDDMDVADEDIES